MLDQYLGIKVDYARDSLIPEQGMALLTKKGFYKKEHEVSPQQGFARAATCYSFGDLDLAQRIYDVVSKKHFTFASPVLSTAVEHEYPTGLKFEDVGNYLKEHIKPDGLPISCFLSYIPDSKEGLVKTRSETAWLSMMGGGIGIYAGMRSPDEKSTGVMSHLRGYDADSLSYKQTETRRGSIGVYLDVDHPEVMNFIDMRSPTGGDPNKKCFNLNNAINLTDDFMQKVCNEELVELVDPKHGKTGRTIPATELWEKMLEMRAETGEPYLNFIDTVNRNKPSWITNTNYLISQSNLCNEIHLMTDKERTAVCCLSSLNLEKYDEWKDTGLVGDLVRFLDNVLEYFIALAPEEVSRAVYSASKERAIGLGALGFHSLLQSRNIPFESGGFNSASQLNNIIFSDIKEQAVAASKVLASERGEPDDCKGSGMRNSHLLALAPNASSSSLIGVSPSIELYAANAYTSQGRAGSFLIKNPHLDKILRSMDCATESWLEAQWKSVIENDGSVQHLEYLTPHQKMVFKTSNEVDQRWVIEHAADRQKKICQGQSLNIAVSPDITKQALSDLHMLAWKKGVKGLYYCRSASKVKASVSKSGINPPLNSVNVIPKFEECLSCQA